MSKPAFGPILFFAIAFALSLFSLSLVACSEDSESPTGVPGGGQEYVLDYDSFAAAVAPIFAQRGCNADGDCHGGGIRGTFALSPESAPDSRFDFAQAVLQIDGNTPTASMLLRKPLAEAAGGAPHGAATFDSTTDADYMTILAWIESGEFR